MIFSSAWQDLELDDNRNETYPKAVLHSYFEWSSWSKSLSNYEPATLLQATLDLLTLKFLVAGEAADERLL
jgi:hypothetical protein